jgi:peptidoglycan-associated lipoprotein
LEKDAMNTTTKLLMTAALISVAACSKKKPADLPPPPAQTDTSSSVPSDSGAVSGTAVAGSRADFLAQAGSDTVHFATDSYSIDAESNAILAKQAQWLQAHPNVKATIEGHCDERGTREYNLALGDRRANSVKNALVSSGVSAAQLSTISYGKERPVATGSDEASWAENRRAVTVVPE